MELETQVEVKATRKKAGADSSEALSGKRLKVKFRRNPDAGGASDGVYIGLNGETYAYKYDVEVDVPDEVLAIADAAVMTKFESDGKGNMTSTEVPRFPYQVIR